MQIETFPTQQHAVSAIMIEVRSVYGELKAYPACPKARVFADLAGTKTLTQASLRLIQELGIEIVSIASTDWRQVR